MDFSKRELERARRLLCGLQECILASVRRARTRGMATWACVGGRTPADTIYRVDRVGESAVLGWFRRHWPREWPVELVMEGLPGSGTTSFPPRTPIARTLFKCILDPVDGTRNLMYDKRSAWTLAALAPQRGPETSLSDLLVAAMTELPTSKQDRADQFSALRGCGLGGIVARTLPLRGGKGRRLRFRPSGATHFAHGFASFVLFFQEGKALTARIEEDLWAALGSEGRASPVFEDQYLSSAGQLHELMVGHDRMIGDLRPLVLSRLGIRSSMVCHPYDLCTWFLLEEAGGVVEDPLGRPLRAPLDTTSAVAWMGYANPVLARRVRPVLRSVLRRHGLP